MNSPHKRIALLRGLAAFVVLGAGFALSKPAEGQLIKVQRKVAGEYIVVLKDTVSAANISNIAQTLAKTHQGTAKRTFRHALKGFSARLTEAQAQALAKNPLVAYVEENGLVHASEAQLSPPWGLDRIDQRAQPSDGIYHYGLTGEGVNVYVIDTGIRVTHEEFEGRASVAFDAIGDGAADTDPEGHGTHVAGTIAGKTYGVAKKARVCAVRVLDANGNGSWEQVIAGVDWVTANRSGPSVANMSLGGGASESVDQAVQNSIASGVVYVLAAGNNGFDASFFSPARVSAGITVGATDSTDTRAGFSNYGSVVDLFAPGVDVLSAGNSSDAVSAAKSGTSMAAPHVAGLAALVLQSSPGASPADVAATLVGNATPALVSDPGPESPNLLAFHPAVAPLAVILPSEIEEGQSVTLVRAGYCGDGAAFTENVIWKPNGQPEVLGITGLGSSAYLPRVGPGTYWWQFRLVDNHYNYRDQWISFTVHPSAGFYLIPNASVSPSVISNGQSVTLVRDGRASAGVAWTESVIWQPNGQADVLGNLPLGSSTYTPVAGPGLYWLQYRFVDTNYNYEDQWLTFTVNP